MKVTLKTKEEIALLKKSGKILVAAMNLAIARAKRAVTEDVTTMELDEIVEKYIRDNDATPAFCTILMDIVSLSPALFAFQSTMKLCTEFPKRTK